MAEKSIITLSFQANQSGRLPRINLPRGWKCLGSGVGKHADDISWVGPTSSVSVAYNRVKSYVQKLKNQDVIKHVFKLSKSTFDYKRSSKKRSSKKR